jgi:chaperonin GroEL (HSP60 family)
MQLIQTLSFASLQKDNSLSRQTLAISAKKGAREEIGKAIASNFEGAER